MLVRDQFLTILDACQTKEKSHSQQISKRDPWRWNDVKRKDKFLDKFDLQPEKKLLLLRFSTEVKPQKDSYFHSVENLWKSSFFYLEKLQIINSLDYLMADIRFFIGLIEAVSKDEIGQSASLKNHYPRHLWVLIKDLAWHFYSSNRFGSLNYKKKEPRRTFIFLLIKMKRKTFKSAFCD